MGILAHPTKQKAIHSIHAIDDFAKNGSFEEIFVFVAQKVAQYVAPFKIHAAERDVTVWEKNIAMMPFLNACQRSGDWLPRFDDVRIDASTPATQRSRANERFGGD
ncbi:hypothetical protein MEA186_00791 [Mesorhizobium amorphae CCNWGS0123]|uniref:Uncharacterized protein n=1 Tax=Mesorhizobium amorphae CCNWGS0123 TaxID=1082933 RepID=G6Y2L7_9HYPH|nr:hypothetical protein A6B35_31930 [Mesorhizobium amorphae CCNWGS0123]EHH13978.1 hypothetical protein MEA186_00791 [Mesorhizobium amorphae CCNWGS0123]